MAKFQEAGAAETLRSSQKDEQYMRHMRSLFSEIVQGGLGISHWLRWRQAYDSISDLTYFVLTTLSGFQTLGEEYVHVIQVDYSMKRLPSTTRRAMNILLHVLGPVAAISARKYIERRLDVNSPSPLVTDQHQRYRVLKFLELLVWLAMIVHRLNLVMFYFGGRYYHISKRLSGIRYILIRRWLAQLGSQTPYRILGYVAAVQLSISVLLDIHKFISSKSITFNDSPKSVEKPDANNEVVENPCSLCVEKLEHATVTPCGHLFCWSCITMWLQSKEECPLCREKFGPSRLVYLQNYI